ncbi:MAG: hypothetical protein O6766_00930 [Gammaproteobacteria bacterium]|nr:hypothetical protein [Gammaproteobacteria bacterium]
MRILSALLVTAAVTSLTVTTIASAGQASDRLFADEAVTALTLTAPFRAISRDRSADPEYRPGTLSYTTIAGTTREFKIKIRPRGKSRRDRKVCSFPPLRLNLPKGKLDNSVFENQNILKLVTHCKTSEKYQRYLLKEFLVYKMLNVLTPVSFNVRLLKVSYVDSEKDGEPLERYGFFIEHKKRLAARLDLATSDVMRIRATDLDPWQASIAEVFQYMISNTDYSFIAAPAGDACCHNAIILGPPGGPYAPVPYDFDRTGMVAPPSALPDENLGQRNVRDRLYRGFCRDQAVTDRAVDHTVDKRDELEGLIRNQVGLEEGDKKKFLRYLESYYNIVADEKRRTRALKCRKPI